jgi:hypothetical protein
VDDGEWNHNDGDGVGNGDVSHEDGDDVGNVNGIIVLVKEKCVGL